MSKETIDAGAESVMWTPSQVAERNGVTPQYQTSGEVR
jgi:hypothetical protein